MNTKLIALIIFILTVINLSVYNTFGQDSKYKVRRNFVRSDLSTIYLYNSASVNYERMVLYRKFVKANINIGLGGWVIKDNGHFKSYLGIPCSANFLIGNENHFELNYGIIYLNPFLKISDRERIFPNLSVGYRHQILIEDNFFRIFIGTYGLGFGYGYSF
jgi:hypothetical protein